MLDEDGVTGQVAMNDGRVARVQITVENRLKRQMNTYKLYETHFNNECISCM